MKKLLSIMFAVMILVAGMAISANALVITSTLGEFSSPFHDVGSYNDTYDVGTFSFDLQGEAVVSATISGQWGNSGSMTTAHNTLYLDGVTLADTNDYSPNPYNNYNVPWSYSFSDFSIFADGEALFQTMQTSEYYVRLGETTLTIETAPIPEPGTIMLLGFGLAGFAGFRKKKF